MLCKFPRHGEMPHTCTLSGSSFWCVIPADITILKWTHLKRKHPIGRGECSVWFTFASFHSKWSEMTFRIRRASNIRRKQIGTRRYCFSFDIQTFACGCPCAHAQCPKFENTNCICFFLHLFVITSTSIQNSVLLFQATFHIPMSERNPVCRMEMKSNRFFSTTCSRFMRLIYRSMNKDFSFFGIALWWSCGFCAHVTSLIITDKCKSFNFCHR